jgi:hypothetical protein
LTILVKLIKLRINFLLNLFDKELNSNEAQDLFLLPVKAKSSMIQIWVYDTNNGFSLVNGNPFSSITATSQFFNVYPSTIYNYLDNNKPFKGYLLFRNKKNF